MPNDTKCDVAVEPLWHANGVPMQAYLATHRSGYALNLTAPDEAGALEALRMAYRASREMPEVGNSDWKIEPAGFPFCAKLDVADLLKSLERGELLDALRTAGVVALDVCIEGKWYACICLGEEAPDHA